MAEWSSKQMVGDRVKQRLGRMRGFKRIGRLEVASADLSASDLEIGNRLEAAVDELRRKFDERQKLVVDVRSDMSEARRLTDDDIKRARGA